MAVIFRPSLQPSMKPQSCPACHLVSLAGHGILTARTITTSHKIIMVSIADTTDDSLHGAYPLAGKLTYHYSKAQAQSQSQSQSQSQPLQQPQQPQQSLYYGPTPIVAANSQYATNHMPYTNTARMQRSSTYSTANAAQLSTVPGSHSSPTAYDRHGAAQQTTQTPQIAPLISPSGQYV